ncbi:hypothetical protein FB451DRAFT_1189719 [Mycena latifolia]|nr:hypothetical protein FB451DRAFT_1189719 [Mycena latifolia]
MGTSWKEQMSHVARPVIAGIPIWRWDFDIPIRQTPLAENRHVDWAGSSPAASAASKSSVNHLWLLLILPLGSFLCLSRPKLLKRTCSHYDVSARKRAPRPQWRE